VCPSYILDARFLKVNLGAGWEVGGQCHAPAVLPPGQSRYPLYRRLGDPQSGLSQSGRVGNKNLLLLPESNIDSSVTRPTAQSLSFLE
jgi:hypothetical protein